jgi:hypothetical protein
MLRKPSAEKCEGTTPTDVLANTAAFPGGCNGGMRSLGDLDDYHTAVLELRIQLYLDLSHPRVGWAEPSAAFVRTLSLYPLVLSRVLTRIHVE